MALVLVLDNGERRAVTGYTGDLLDSLGVKIASVVDGLIVPLFDLIILLEDGDMLMCESGDLLSLE